MKKTYLKQQILEAEYKSFCHLPRIYDVRRIKITLKANLNKQMKNEAEQKHLQKLSML